MSNWAGSWLSEWDSGWLGFVEAVPTPPIPPVLVGGGGIPWRKLFPKKKLLALEGIARIRVDAVVVRLLRVQAIGVLNEERTSLVFEDPRSSLAAEQQVAGQLVLVPLAEQKELAGIASLHLRRFEKSSARLLSMQASGLICYTPMLSARAKGVQELSDEELLSAVMAFWEEDF